MLAPEGAIEEALFARIAGCLWRLGRIVRLESEMIGGRDGPLGTALLERGWLRAVAGLRSRSLFAR